MLTFDSLQWSVIMYSGQLIFLHRLGELDTLVGEDQELLQELAERAFDEAASATARRTSQRGA